MLLFVNEQGYSMIVNKRNNGFLVSSFCNKVFDIDSISLCVSYKQLKPLTRGMCILERPVLHKKNIQPGLNALCQRASMRQSFLLGVLLINGHQNAFHARPHEAA